MAQPRDFGQRKIYALLRVSRAVARMGQAESATEKERAAFWIIVWSKLKGTRQFKQDRRI
jgi:hypothetical protein